MDKKLTIKLTNEQAENIKRHLTTQSEINQKEETFSGFSFTLSATESGISWLELEMNSKVDLGEVSWDIE